MSITVRWGSYVWPAWVNYKPWCFHRKILINWWSVTSWKTRVLRRLQFYLDFEILAFKQLCYSLQSHSPHWMDSVSLVHLKAEHEYSTEFSLFEINNLHKSDLKYFYSNLYVGLCDRAHIIVSSPPLQEESLFWKEGCRIYIRFNI